jgi:predicted DNA-binding WGR domain protein
MRRFIQDKGRNEKPQIWEITCTQNAVQVMWGQQGGAMQDTVQDFEAVNVGKKNEKSPETVAQEWMERQILLRTRKGYVEVDLRTGKPLKKVSAGELKSFMELPQNLRFYKPQNSMNTYISKLIATHNALFLRKRDGMMHVVSVDEEGTPRLYSSTMAPAHKDEPHIPWLDRYPHLEQALRSDRLKPKTILLGELCTSDEEGEVDDMGYAKDNFEYVGSIVKSLTPLALNKQEEHGRLGFCIWDIAYWDGDPFVVHARGEDRYNFIWNLAKDVPWLTMPELVEMRNDGYDVRSLGSEAASFEYETDDPEADLSKFAKDRGWEGWVVVDPEAKGFGDRAFNFHGKAERPKEAVKLKPELEADFVVYWDPEKGQGEYGKGKKKNGVGSVMAYLHDPEEAVMREICKVGGGLSDEDVARFADPTLYPMVWVVAFSEWTPKGALRFPKFIRERDDKDILDCTIDQNPAWRTE